MRKLDQNLIAGSALLSVGMAFARILGFAYSLVLAKAFTSEDYGAIQYAITLSMVVSIGTQPFGQHVVARFVGKYKDDAYQLRRILANAWAILAILFGLTLLVAVPVLSALGKLNLGILIIFLGTTLFYAYWGLSRGFLAPNKLTAAYSGSNLLQLVLVLFLIYFLGIRSPSLALLIYGLSYLVPLALLQIFWPFPVRLELSLLRRDVIGELIRFSQPIWVSHACFMLYNSIDVLLLERHSGTAAVGVYMVAKTLALVFLFVPTGIATLLMPKAAALPRKAHPALLRRMLALSLLIDGVILIAYLFLGGRFVQSVFGPEYVMEMRTSIVLALGMIVIGAESVVSAVVVGSGRPGIETISRIVAVLAAASVGLLLIPVSGMLGAATSLSMGALSGLITYGVAALTRKRRKEPTRKRTRVHTGETTL